MAITLYILDGYTPIKNLKYTIVKDLQDMKFPVGKYKLIAQKTEKMCYAASTIISIITVLGCLIFHPVIGDSSTVPTRYILEYINNYRVVVYTIIFIQMVLIMYAQLIPVYGCYCMGWSIQIFHFRLLEYIDNNLCKNYHSFDIINEHHEQKVIAFHLKKCIQYHKHLKR